MFIQHTTQKWQIYVESGSDTEKLGFANVVVPHQYEPTPNQLKVSEPASSSDVTEDEKAGLHEGIPDIEYW